MLFLVIETFRPGCAPEVYRRFREQGRLAPDGLQYIDSWVDLDFRRCFQIMAAVNEEPVRAWAARWSDLVEFEIIPVQTSAAAAATMAARPLPPPP